MAEKLKDAFYKISYPQGSNTIEQLLADNFPIAEPDSEAYALLVRAKGKIDAIAFAEDQAVDPHGSALVLSRAIDAYLTKRDEETVTEAIRRHEGKR